MWDGDGAGRQNGGSGGGSAMTRCGLRFRRRRHGYPPRPRRRSAGRPGVRKDGAPLMGGRNRRGGCAAGVGSSLRTVNWGGVRACTRGAACCTRGRIQRRAISGRADGVAGRRGGDAAARCTVATRSCRSPLDRHQILAHHPRCAARGTAKAPTRIRGLCRGALPLLPLPGFTGDGQSVDG